MIKIKHILMFCFFSLFFKTSFFYVAGKQSTVSYFSVIAPWSSSLEETSVHEAGHILFAFLLDNLVSSKIIEKSDLLIFTEITGETITYFSTSSSITLKEELNRICFYLAGGVATEIVFGYKIGISKDEKDVKRYLENLIEKYEKIFDSLEEVKNYFGLSSFKKEDFNFNFLKKECLVKTKKILSENVELLTKLSKELEKRKQLDFHEIENLICDISFIDIK